MKIDDLEKVQTYLAKLEELEEVLRPMIHENKEWGPSYYLLTSRESDEKGEHRGPSLRIGFGDPFYRGFNGRLMEALAFTIKDIKDELKKLGVEL